MPISGRELTGASEAARLLLERLGLDDWYFSLEPRETGPWELRLECSGWEGWRAFSFPVEPSELIGSLDDPDLAQRMLADWRAKLSQCSSHAGPPPRSSSP
ncbi:MAG TPA: hypothetical protein DFS52_07510 [Myxococcales bacterium]|jgi:hypothetical protein|nr:hypothetical protein [Myxococcales bacterium]